MKLIWIVILVLAIYLVAQFAMMFKAKSDIENRVEYRLDFVDGTSVASVKRDLVADAAKIGVELKTDNINIVYQDTEDRTYSQKVVGDRIGAEFSNKHVGINVEYDARILGFAVHQRITASKIKQIAAPSLQRNRAAQEVLDSQP